MSRNINKIIIWGHELHNHTHSYIHNAFYIAFKYMGYDVYWFNRDGKNNYDDKNICFENTLYISHGLECENLPINDTSFYILHNSEMQVISSDRKIPKNHNGNIGIKNENFVNLQVYTADCKNFQKYNNIEYYRYHDNIIFMPWATDLLPNQINFNIQNLNNMKNENICNFIGMPIEYNVILKNELLKHNIIYANFGGTFNINSDRNKSIEENMELIQKSIIAPSLQSQWQIDHHYIPCRIFKNISYGKMGMTNNNSVNELFDNKLLYSENIEELIKMSLDFEKRKDKNILIKELMEKVRDNHTYINRINFILDCIKQKYGVEIK